MNENLNLYKEFYFREIDTKNHLTNAVNVPIIVITAIISMHFYIFSQDLNSDLLIFGKVISSINLASTLVALFFLTKSFSNLISSHTYREIADMGQFRDFEVKLIEEQEKRSDAQFLFERHLIKEFTLSSKHNSNVNKNRTEDLAKTKISLFLSVFLTIIFSITYIISIL